MTRTRESISPEEPEEDAPGAATARALNELAKRYEAASDPVSKRNLLHMYLFQLEMVASMVFPWSSFGKAEPPRLSLRPLHELSEGLLRLNQGETPELLTRAKRSKTTSRRDQFFRAQAAALIDALMERGKSEEDAARAVARQLVTRRLSITRPSETPLWEQLQTWRENVRRGKTSARARAWYDDAKLFASCFETERDLYDALLNLKLLPLEPLRGNTV